MVSIQVDVEKIQQMAYDLSQEQKSWDDFVWLFAEAELRLKPAYVLGKLYKEGDESRTVDIDESAIVDQPSEDDIRQLAEEISKQGLSMEDLNWGIAERRFIYNQVNMSAFPSLKEENILQSKTEENIFRSKKDEEVFRSKMKEIRTKGVTEFDKPHSDEKEWGFVEFNEDKETAEILRDREIMESLSRSNEDIKNDQLLSYEDLVKRVEERDLEEQHKKQKKRRK